MTIEPLLVIVEGYGLRQTHTDRQVYMENYRQAGGRAAGRTQTDRQTDRYI